MRVLHVISGIEAQNGGPTNALIGLTKAQRHIGLDVRVVSTWRHPDGPANVPAFTANGVPVEMIGPAWTARMWNPRIGTTLRRLIGEADVVHVHALFEEIQHRAAVISREMGKPYIMRPCGALDPWVQSRGRLKKWFYMAARLRRNLNRAAAIHYVTAAERDAAASLGLTSRSIVEPNGIDLAEFDPLPARGALRRTLGISDSQRVVLFLGRIDYKKGLDLLVPAFAATNLPDTILVLAGPDSYGYRQQIESLIQHHDLSSRVLFTGMLSGHTRIEALVDADLFAMTSYVENFGVSLIEALAAGKDVLISENVNLSKDLAAASIGRIVRADVNDIAQGLRAWNQEPRRTFRTEHQTFAVEQFNWRNIARRWEQHYMEMVR